MIELDISNEAKSFLSGLVLTSMIGGAYCWDLSNRRFVEGLSTQIQLSHNAMISEVMQDTANRVTGPIVGKTLDLK